MAGDDRDGVDDMHAPDPSGKRYDAFISYSHSADGELAPALQASVQRLAKPWRKRRALEVFRDQTSLSANPALWTSITTALDGSKWFVLLSSPDATRSLWVGKEIEHWVQRHGASTILPVVTEGTWVWDTTKNDFDLERSTAVHPALLGVFSEEPRFIDLSWARTETDLTLKNARFRDQVAEIAAPMHGLTKDELEGEDVRQQRRTMRIARGAGVGLAALTVAALIASGLAVASQRDAAKQRDAATASAAEALAQRAVAEENAAEAVRQQGIAEDQQAIAEEQQAIAEEQARTAASRLLATTTENSADGSLHYLLAAQSYMFAQTAQARSAVLAATRGGLVQRMLGFQGGVIDAEFDPSGARLVTVDGLGTIRLWEVGEAGDGTVVTSAGVDATFVSPNELVVSTGAAVQWYDIESGTIVAERTDLLAAPTHLAPLPDGSVVVGTDVGDVLVVRREGDVTVLGDRPDYRLQASVTFIGTSTDGSRIVAAVIDASSGLSRTVVVWDGDLAPVSTWQSAYEVRDVSADGSLVATVAVNDPTSPDLVVVHQLPDGRGLLSSILRTDDGTEVGVLTTFEPYGARDAGFVGGNERVRVVTTSGVDGAPAAGWLGRLTPVESETAGNLTGTAGTDLDSALVTAVSDDGTMTFTGGAGAEAELLRLDDGSSGDRVTLLPPDVETVFPLSAATEKDLVVAASAGAIGVWDMTSQTFSAIVPDVSQPATISHDGSSLVSYDGGVFDVATAAAPGRSSATDRHCPRSQRGRNRAAWRTQWPTTTKAPPSPSPTRHAARS